MRRIEALTGAGADAYLRARCRRARARRPRRSAPRPSRRCPDRIRALQDELRETRRRLKAGAAAAGALPKPGELAGRAEEVAPGVRARRLRRPVRVDRRDEGRGEGPPRALSAPGVIALGLDADEPQLFVTVSDDLVGRGHRRRRPRPRGERGDRRPRRRPAGDGPGQGHPARGSGRGPDGHPRRGTGARQPSMTPEIAAGSERVDRRRRDRDRSGDDRPLLLREVGLWGALNDASSVVPHARHDPGCPASWRPSRARTSPRTVPGADSDRHRGDGRHSRPPGPPRGPSRDVRADEAAGAAPGGGRRALVPVGRRPSPAIRRSTGPSGWLALVSGVAFIAIGYGFLAGGERHPLSAIGGVALLVASTAFLGILGVRLVSGELVVPDWNL